MPWNSVDRMDERYRFVSLAVQPDANISELCRQFGISRKTGYKLLNRYRAQGRAGVAEQSRRPKTIPHQVGGDMACEIVAVRNAHPRWAGTTIRAVLLRTYGKEEVPSARTIDRVLDRCGMIEHRRRRRSKRIYSPEQILRPTQPNDVWTVDFKGWWLTKDGIRCLPLTIRDEYSRYILEIAALTEGTTEAVKRCFTQCFEKYGMPRYIRSDNGSPFAASEALQKLSALSVWWIKLGVMPNRIPPSSPWYNGGHERMHKDLCAEVQINPARNCRQQQGYLDAWREEFNTVRPHRALKMKTPGDVYQCAKRTYRDAKQPFDYESFYELRKVGARGDIFWKGNRRFIAGALTKETIGIRVQEEELELFYCDFFLGTTDLNFSERVYERNQNKSSCVTG
jgi:putative transposase